ncbi:hypothetical protein D3C87_1646270 [compost metagenome]
MDPLVRLVPFVEEVHDNHVVRLPIPMASPDALLNSLGVPGKIVVDDLRTELKIDPLRRSLCGNHDRCVVTEFVNQCRAHIDLTRP